MGIAKRTVAAIQDRASQKETRLKFSLHSSLIAGTAAPNMWDELAQAIEGEVKELARSVLSLRADQPVPNNLTIQTTVAPIHILTLVRTEVGIQSTLISSSRRLLARRSEQHLPPLFFSTDEGLRPCFSDGYGSLDLDAAVDFLLEPLCNLFDDF